MGSWGVRGDEIEMWSKSDLKKRTSASPGKPEYTLILLYRFGIWPQGAWVLTDFGKRGKMLMVVIIKMIYGQMSENLKDDHPSV